MDVFNNINKFTNSPPWLTSPLHNKNLNDRIQLLSNVLDKTCHVDELIMYNYNPTIGIHTRSMTNYIYHCEPELITWLKNCTTCTNTKLRMLINWPRRSKCNRSHIDCWSKYVLYDLVCAVIPTEDLKLLVGKIYGFNAYIVVDHLLFRGISLTEFPRSDLASWLVEDYPPTTPHMLNRLASVGYAIQLPVPFNINPASLLWILKTFPNEYPHSRDINFFCKGRLPLDRLIKILMLIVYGKYIPDGNGMSALIFNANFYSMKQQWPEGYKVFVEYINQWLYKQYHVFIDPWNGVNIDCNITDEILYAIVSNVNACCISYLVDWLFEREWIHVAHLNTTFWLLYFRKYGHIGDYLREDISTADNRVVDYLFPSVKYALPLTAPYLTPPFHTQPSGKFKINNICIPVYVEYIIHRSDFLEALTSNKGFKQEYDEKEKVIHLRSIPLTIKNMEKCIINWANHCYTGQLPLYFDEQDAEDLYNLACYLLDSICMNAVLEWLKYKYLSEFELHRKCVSDGELVCKSCTVCKSWFNTAQLEQSQSS